MFLHLKLVFVNKIANGLKIAMKVRILLIALNITIIIFVYNACQMTPKLSLYIRENVINVLINAKYVVHLY